MAGLNCEIKWETRLCEVNGELGYFHCGAVIPEARSGKSMALWSLRTASGGLTLRKSSSAMRRMPCWQRWRNIIRRGTHESLHFIKR